MDHVGWSLKHSIVYQRCMWDRSSVLKIVSHYLSLYFGDSMCRNRIIFHLFPRTWIRNPCGSHVLNFMRWGRAPLERRHRRASAELARMYCVNITNFSTYPPHNGNSANPRRYRRHMGSSQGLLRTLALQSRLSLFRGARQMGPISMRDVQQWLWDGHWRQGWEDCGSKRTRSR